MPLNEAEGYVHSNLTEKQQREAEKAIYGLDQGPSAMTPETFTFEERVKMRRFLDELDSKDAANSTKEFDLNKPPTKPYVYSEFPYLMYNHETRQTRPAHNNEQRERMLDQGWSIAPFPVEGAEIPMTPAEHAEADEVNARLKKSKRP